MSARCAMPVEFLIDALDDADDLPAIARQLTAQASHGRVACGQSDPTLLELTVRGESGEKRLIYRVEPEQILVLWAESVAPTRH